MASLELTQLNQNDIPSTFPDPLRRVLLDLFTNLNQFGEDITAALDAATTAQSTGEAAQQSSEVIEDSVSKVANLAQSASNLATSNADLISELQTAIGDLGDIEGDYVSKSDTNHQEIVSSLGVAGYLDVDGDQVLIKTETGWAASTGTKKNGGIDADISYPVSSTPTQAEVQAIADGLVETRKVLIAIIDALTNHHKLIGPTPTL